MAGILEAISLHFIKTFKVTIISPILNDEIREAQRDKITWPTYMSASGIARLEVRQVMVFQDAWSLLSKEEES